MFNNAGYAVFGEIESTPDNVARSLIEANFWGAANISREAVKFFREANEPSGGRLLQMSSVNGISVYPLLGFYNAAKSGMYTQPSAGGNHSL